MKIYHLLIASILVLFGMAANAQVLEKCFQAQLVHKSTCNTNLAPEDCAPALIDVDPEYWIYVPQGLCEKLTGQAPVSDPTATAND